ncbi:hypothetical protein SAMN05216603_10640 [Pseudomonas benzenivorans]|nr:hypothetical protein SAMN05216603_10640 [Pseudomonas benzenivorans]
MLHEFVLGTTPMLEEHDESQMAHVASGQGGEIGRQLALMQEIDHNGPAPLLEPLRQKPLARGRAARRVGAEHQSFHAAASAQRMSCGAE